MSQAYDEDVLEWSEHQAALLRRLASGDQANETPDWENIIEEVESGAASCPRCGLFLCRRSSMT